MRRRRPLADRVATVGALDDPVRLALLQVVGRSATPLSRDQAAQALGVTRRAAAFHLDRLVEEGLLAVDFRRLTGRTGPGSGRPSKLYRRTAEEVAVAIPDRHYDLAGELLAAAVEESARGGEPAWDALMRLAADAGRDLGEDAGTLDDVLQEIGYEPRPDGRGGILLGNCPFHRLAQRHTDVVCHLNLELLRGAAGAVDDEHAVVLDPGAGRCCVRILAES